MDLFVTATLSEYTHAWPLWSAGLLVSVVLIFARQPTRLRRILGAYLLGLGLTGYGYTAYFFNGCIEGYADWTSCDVGGLVFTLGLTLLAGTVVWSIRSMGRIH